MWHTLHLDYGIQAPRRNVEGIVQQLDLEGSCTKEKVVYLPRPEFLLGTLTAFLFMVGWTVSVVESCR